MELLHRSFHAWFALAALFCLAMAVVPYSGVLAIPGGLAMYFLSIELAAFSDRQQLTLVDLPGLVQSATHHALELVWRRRWVLLVAFTVSYAMVLAMPHSPRPEPVDTSSVWVWCFGIESPFVMAAAALWAGTYYQGAGLQMAMMTYCVSRWARTDNDMSYRLVTRAAQKNFGAAVFLDGLHIGALLVALMAAPILTPLLFCVLPAVTYVAFREMFVDADGNRKPLAAPRLAPLLSP